MSKKSRRRNRRLLTALAALGGAAMLAGRGKKPNMDIPDRNRGMMPTGIDKKISDVYPDAIMRGGKGVKPARVFPRLKVTDRGNVIRDGVDTGVGNRKSAFVSGNTIFQDGKAFTGGRFGSFKAQKEMERGMLPPQLRNPGRTNITTAQGENRQFFKDIGNLIFPKANFKSGGRVKKAKATGIAKRGFGRALKKRSK